jgi:hypothetical protein
MRISGILYCVAFVLLAGCATQLLPDDYKGETAVLRDSYANFRSGGLLGPDSAQFFVADEVDGKRIDNALGRTAMSNEGRGFAMTPVPYERRVPIRAMKVDLYGIVHYTAPIVELVNKTYETRRKVTFTPEPGGRYVVRGRLGESGSSLWIETEDGRVVAQ